MTKPLLTLPQIEFQSHSSRWDRIMEKVRVSITRMLMRFQRVVCCWEGEGWKVMLEGVHVVIAACHSGVCLYSYLAAGLHANQGWPPSWARGKHTKFPIFSSDIFLAWDLVGQEEKGEIFLRSHDSSAVALISIQEACLMQEDVSNAKLQCAIIPSSFSKKESERVFCDRWINCCCLAATRLGRKCSFIRLGIVCQSTVYRSGLYTVMSISSLIRKKKWSQIENWTSSFPAFL